MFAGHVDQGVHADWLLLDVYPVAQGVQVRSAVEEPGSSTTNPGRQVDFVAHVRSVVALPSADWNSVLGSHVRHGWHCSALICVLNVPPSHGAHWRFDTAVGAAVSRSPSTQSRTSSHWRSDVGVGATVSYSRSSQVVSNWHVPAFSHMPSPHEEQTRSLTALGGTLSSVPSSHSSCA